MLKSKKSISLVLLVLFLVECIGLNKLVSVSAAINTYNYGEAFQKAIMFYEFQRSGKLPSDKRDNWRGDSGLDDGKDAGLDLTGGWYDAGDNVKFNLPMSYSAAMLAWSVYEDKDAYEKSGQLSYIKNAIKWANDYLIKCNPEKNVYYYQVGDGNSDHSFWGPPEVMQMNRPSYKVDINNPGSTVTAETAASLAAASLVFKDSDPEYSSTCIKHAKDLFDFADTTRSDAGYKAAAGFYDINSGFWDELSWAATWLYLATNDENYLEKAESYVGNWGTDQEKNISYTWGQCWDDVHYGAELLLARITNKDIYKDSIERHLDYWTTGYNGSRIKYTPKGLAWLNSWGSLRYATTTAFLAGVYSEWSGCTSSKATTYKEFLKNQIDYALGSTGRSFEVGFGTNPPERPHHRGAHSSWANNMDTPSYHRHVLYGALVGGPGADDSYTDSINDYMVNEVACDYNAGFVGALAKMYKVYGGTPITDFKDIEAKTNDEYFVEAGVNASGSNFVEIKAILNNKSGWPAKVSDKLSFKYFIDISEFVKAGYTVNDITTSTNYNDGAVVSKLIPWDTSKNIYYINVDFTGTKIYPGGQSNYRKEVQFRISGPQNAGIWDNSNDFSYKGITTTVGGTPVQTSNIPVYDNGVLIFGDTPDNGGNTSKTGDLNKDGKVDNLDYIILEDYIMNPDSSIDTKGYDLNEDGRINTADLFALKKII